MKNKQIHIHLTEKEYDILIKYAEKKALNISAYILEKAIYEPQREEHDDDYSDISMSDFNPDVDFVGNFTTGDAAKMLGVSSAQVRRLMKNNKIAHVIRDGRYMTNRNSILAYIHAYEEQHIMDLDDGDMISVTVAANMIPCDKKTVLRRIHNGELRAIKLNPSLKNSKYLVSKNDVIQLKMKYDIKENSDFIGNQNGNIFSNKRYI